MQNSFLRSDSEDLIKLQQNLHSKLKSSLNDIHQSFGFFQKLVEELQRAKQQNNQQQQQEFFTAESNNASAVEKEKDHRAAARNRESRNAIAEEDDGGIPPRRSMSVPHTERTPRMTATTMVTNRSRRPQLQHNTPYLNSRLVTVRHSRISSSHGDLDKIAQRDYSPPLLDDDSLYGEHGAHIFQTKRNFLRIQCDRCEMQIRFGILYVKCHRCKASFHEACRKQAPLPCVVRKITPKPTGSKSGRLRLGDYCADNRPMVPPLITYCTYALDNQQNIPFEDIYQMDGDIHEVDCILKLFKSNKTFPKLEHHHSLNIAGSVKRFLTQIREPLVPFTYGKEIVSVLAVPEKLGAVTGIVEDLPSAHKDTLSHLCRHLKRLLNRSNGQLTVGMLSACLGPILFGSSRLDSPIQNGAAINASRVLIELPNEFWANISASPGTSRSQTPTRTPSVRSNNQTPKCGMPNHGTIGGGPIRNISRNASLQREQPKIALDSTEESSGSQK